MSEQKLIDNWLPGIAIVRVPKAPNGYEWMAYAAEGKGMDLLGKHKAHGCSLRELLWRLGELAN